MQPRIGFCTRCGGLRFGWNKRYVIHWLWCKHWLGKSSTLGGTAVVAALILSFPRPNASVSSVPKPRPTAASVTVAVDPVVPVVPEVHAMKAFLKRHKVDETNCDRLAKAIVVSARKYRLNPRLLASIMIVESRGNPFAISGQNAIGIMQIHLPTWGTTAVSEDINLFKMEDNVDFGARILKDYVRRFGLSEGVRRYNGFIPGVAAWEESSQRYLDKVQQIYAFEQAPTLQASLVK